MKTYPLNKNTINALISNFSIWRDKGVEGEWLVTIEKEPHEKRSTEANKRHWQLMEQIAHHMRLKGHDHSLEVWHEFFKRLFLEGETIEIMGKTLRNYPSRKLNTKQFAEWDDKIEAHAATEWGFTFLDQKDWPKYRDAST